MFFLISWKELSMFKCIFTMFTLVWRKANISGDSYDILQTGDSLLSFNAKQ